MGKRALYTALAALVAAGLAAGHLINRQTQSMLVGDFYNADGTVHKINDGLQHPMSGLIGGGLSKHTRHLLPAGILALQGYPIFQFLTKTTKHLVKLGGVIATGTM
jgi:hypothetical protein